MIHLLNIHIGTSWYGEVSAHWREENRKIYDYIMSYYPNCSGKIILEDAVFQCTPGCVVIIPPDYEHCSIYETGGQRWAIHFDWFGNCPAYQSADNLKLLVSGQKTFNPELLAQKFPESMIHFPALFQLSQENNAVFNTLIRRFFSADVNSFYGQLERLGLFHQMLALVLASSEGQKKNSVNSLALRAKDIIDKQFTDPSLEIRIIARQLRVTPNHLSRLFHYNFNIAPNMYLCDRRLIHAEYLLCTTDLSVSEIAFLSGFTDANYFSRCFKQHRGVTPVKFRTFGQYRRPDMQICGDADTQR